MNEVIAVGDVVKLKSGSIPMTVEYISESPSLVGAEVVWMVDPGERRSALFAITSLQKA